MATTKAQKEGREPLPGASQYEPGNTEVRFGRELVFLCANCGHPEPTHTIGPTPGMYCAVYIHPDLAKELP